MKLVSLVVCFYLCACADDYKQTLQEAEFIVRILEQQNAWCPDSELCDFRTDSFFLPVPCCNVSSTDTDCETSVCCPTAVPTNYRYLVDRHHGVPRTCVPNTIKAAETGMYAYGSCPQNTEEWLAEKCMNGENTHLTGIAPVSDKATGDVYTNRFCALCNFVPLKDIEIWQATLTCAADAYERFLGLSDFLKSVNDSLTCDVIFKPISPPLEDLPVCLLGNEDHQVCNQTGQWTVYDEFQEFACLFYTSFVVIDREFYRNIFCAMCNGWTQSMNLTCNPYSGEINSPPTNGYLALLVIDTLKMITPNSQCGNNHVYDNVLGKCIEAECSVLRRLVGEACQLLLSDIKTFTYEATIRVVPEFHLRLDDSFALIQDFVFLIIDKLYPPTVRRDCRYQAVFWAQWYNTTDGTHYESTVKYLDITLMRIITGLHDPEQIYETTFSEDFTSFSLSDAFSLPCKVYTRSSARFEDDISSEFTSVTKIFHDSSLTKMMLNESLNHSQFDSKLNLSRFIYMVPFHFYGINQMVVGTNLVTLNTCPKTAVSKNDHPWDETIEGLFFPNYNMSLGSREYYYHGSEQETIFVCLETYSRLQCLAAIACSATELRLKLPTLLLPYAYIRFIQ